MRLLFWLLEPVLEHSAKDIRHILADLRAHNDAAWAIAETMDRLLATVELLRACRVKSKR